MALFLQGTKLDAKIHQKSPIISFSVAFRDIKCITSDYETIYRDSKKAVRFPPCPPSWFNWGHKMLAFSSFL